MSSKRNAVAACWRGVIWCTCFMVEAKNTVGGHAAEIEATGRVLFCKMLGKGRAERWRPFAF